MEKHRAIQWYLKTVHQLNLSAGAIVQAMHGVARQAQPAVREVLVRNRASPVCRPTKPADARRGPSAMFGPRWNRATPTERYFLPRGRDKGMVDEVLDPSLSGVLVSDFYAAYHHYPGLKHRCWAHLMRDIHDLKGPYPDASGS